jgi:acyl carrier protein
MENLEKYNNAFVEVFGAKVEDLNDNYSKETVEEWDSVHQLSLIAQFEEAFDIMFDP